MVLNSYNAIEFILNNGLINHENLLSNDLTFIESLSSRNTVITATYGSNKLILKQAKNLKPEKVVSIENEYNVYKIIKDKAISGFTPELVNYNFYYKIIALEYINSTKSISDILKNADYCDIFFKSFGAKLSSFHISLYNNISRNYTETPFQRISILSHSVGFLQNDFETRVSDFDSFPYRALMNFMNRHTINQKLKEINKKWKETYLIHGDIKIDNLIFKNPSDVIIIDLEFLGFGDVAWDVACFIIAVLKNNSFKDINPIRQDAYIRTFIDSYSKESSLIKNDANFFKKVVRLCGIKLLQDIWSNFREKSDKNTVDLKHLQSVENFLLHSNDFYINKSKFQYLG